MKKKNKKKFEPNMDKLEEVLLNGLKRYVENDAKIKKEIEKNFGYICMGEKTRKRIEENIKNDLKHKKIEKILKDECFIVYKGKFMKIKYSELIKIYEQNN